MNEAEQRMNPSDIDDPYLWLEELASAEVRAWIAERNAVTLGALADARFEADRSSVLDLLNADDRIPQIGRRGSFVYNFWKDAAHPKGIWRRSTLAEYRNKEPAWDVLLDVDALARAEGEDWVWQGCDALPPDYRRGLVRLSRGGADANVTREFDLETRRFLDDGFTLPEAKTSATWMDQDRLLVATPLGGAEFATQSGYARTVRLWRRGTPFIEAPIVFEGERGDVYIYAWQAHEAARPRTFFARAFDFINTELFVEEQPGSRRRIEVPTDAHVSVFRDWLMVNLRTDWEMAGQRFPAGALLVTGFDAFMAGGRDFTTLFTPSRTAFLQGFDAARDAIAFKTLDDVRSRVMLARPNGGAWRTEQFEGFPEQAVVDIGGLDADPVSAATGDGAFVMQVNDAITPPTTVLVRVGETPEALKSAPARFDARGLALTQHHAEAEDGTRIPYFQVARADLDRDGDNPVLMTGYGGFEISLLPYYASVAGKLWLERGGVFVIANIRGGGEFGPAWHEAGRRAGKKRAHDDFAAVARDLIARGMTRPARLACRGGSNGGLLVGNMYARYPELFGAIVCEVPLLDMRRYTKLSAGPSWIAEYGDPDQPEDWAFLKEISAYHRVAPDRAYPPILLTTSARDDRVHPGHARKMAAKLLAFGARVLFHEPAEGGHAGAADNAHVAHNEALVYAFLRQTIAKEVA
ncbi:MAG TPA: prolyl oligopeptidase family serine peptidase [Xanthobacteraceae bacterium]|nr:prolyl oligopeptidase family serine peptidase [Xanthobacteraceae bacterium]